ncbi:MAG: hypothetical protein JWN12_8 [Candidatus Saccharibacteria bacterium]|nr:hypothetical protein [Candidatus Saccharibacteria bacterium]
MDNGQYHIPPEELIQEIESAFDPRDVQEMEKQPSPYEVVKNTEQEIDEFRANATEDTIPRYSMITLARSVVKSIMGR